MTHTLLVLALLFQSTSSFASGALFLFGGGARQPAALRELVEAAGGAGRAHVLVVAWASAEPEASAAALREELATNGAKVSVTLTPPRGPLEAERFLADAAQAGAIFFSGGDQNRILDGFEAFPASRERVLERWRQGAAIAGTSAGTAIFSQWVFTGNEDLTKIDPQALALRPGLALLGNTIVDQHFIVRQRENRLIAALLRYPGTLGVGVDEDNVLVVRGDGLGHVVGPTGVVFVEQAGLGGPTQVLLTLLGQGACWDFTTRRTATCF